MREVQQRQMMIETLLATQRALLEQRDSLSDELCGKMAQLWADVSVAPSGKKRRCELDEPSKEVDGYDNLSYRSCSMSADEIDELSARADSGFEQVAYRSLRGALDDLDLDAAGMGFGADDEAGAAASEHARNCPADATSTFRSAPAVQAETAGGETAEGAAEAEWMLARRLELLIQIGLRLTEANDCLAASEAAEVRSDATAALEGALQISASLHALEAC